jgi:hypothetical protein
LKIQKKDGERNQENAENEQILIEWDHFLDAESSSPESISNFFVIKESDECPICHEEKFDIEDACLSCGFKRF